MIKIDSIKISAKKNIDIKERIINQYNLSSSKINDFSVLKKSLDARDKNNIVYIYSVVFSTDSDKEKYLVKKYGNIDYYKAVNYKLPENKITTANAVIVGFGPAGIFAALILVNAGLKPTVIERGNSIEERIEDVNQFFDNNILNTESNIQFGEGGAGTFSDGKLNTGVKDKEGRIDYILKTFVEFGAPKNILYDSKPHIGTDVLRTVIVNIRNYLISKGARIIFNTKFEEIIEENSSVKAIKVLNCKTHESYFIDCDKLVLAIGHSSRDTLDYLSKVIPMEQKPFAVGFRVIHKQSFIDKAQYGEDYEQIYEDLPTCSYKLTYQTNKEQRGVYSFCMCPGGYVVNASSENNRICVNGMSDNDRNSGFANSAVIIQVKTSDFNPDDVLAGVEFQRQIETNAYNLGNGNIPISSFEQFKGNDIESDINPDIAIKGKYAKSDLTKILPEFLNEAFVEGMENFDKVIKNYSSSNPLMAGIEARTSSPVKILRNDNFQTKINGIFPTGEGAGYAGGIISAAIDGIKTAEMILKG